MNKIKFGTDGWRAIIGDDYTVENVARARDFARICVLPRLGGGRRRRLGQLADAAPVHALRQRRPRPAGVLPVAGSDKAAGGGGTLIVANSLCISSL